MRRFNLKKTIAALAFGGILALIGLSEPSLADLQVNSPRQGLPGRRISGGSRSPNTACLTTPNQPIVALTPKTNLGLTVSAHPTLWFALPAISPDRILEFGLYDSSGELLYTKTFSASEEAGVMSLSLPETSSPLALNQDYKWYLSVVCNQASRAEDLAVSGWIRRVQLGSAVNEQLAIATPLERAAIYESASVWYDALTSLAELRRSAASSSPSASSSSASGPSASGPLQQQWIRLLESAELSQAISAPIGSELTPISHLAQNSPSN